jgi:hypothetical protein
MKYITGQHALNIDCNLNTCGDWHTFAIDWNKLSFCDTEKSTFRDYGIERDKSIPWLPGRYNVANHIRALLDLIELGSFSLAQGMRDDFICCDDYDNEIFDEVLLLRNKENWDAINSFMGREYKMKWVNYINRIAKNTDTVKRVFLNYGVENRPLKIEASYRKNEISKDDFSIIGDVAVYSINALALQKTLAYAGRDKIRDLYDLTFICKEHYHELDKEAVAAVREVLAYKGLEHFDYLINTQSDELINSEKLASDFLDVYDKLGLIVDSDEKELVVKDAKKR